MLAVLAPAKPAAPAVPERYVSLNFDNADISVVIQTIAELLHMNYIVAPTVRGRITIQTSEKLPVSALLPVLEQILEVNGFMAVKSGEFFKIVPANQAKQEAVETVPQEQAPSVSTGLVTKIVQLRYISPGEVVKILTPFKTAAGIYQAHEPARLLFLTEVPAKIADLLKIIEVLDVDTFASIQVELYPVRYAGVEDLARELTQIVTQVFTSAGRGRTLVPDHSRASGELDHGLLRRGRPGGEHPRVDREARPAGVRGQRADLRLPALARHRRDPGRGDREGLPPRFDEDARPRAPLPRRRSRRARTAPAPGQPQAVQTPVTPPKAISSSGEGVGVIGGGSGGRRCRQGHQLADHPDRLLVLPHGGGDDPQARHDAQAGPDRGADRRDHARRHHPVRDPVGAQGAGAGQRLRRDAQCADPHANVYGGLAAATTGFSFFLTEAGRLTAALNAYAKDSKLNILSAPHIIATNNKEAKIDVGQEVPILKRTISDPNNTTATTSTNEIEYRSTGIILTVTPHINEGGYVTLDVNQEVSEAQTNTLGGTDSPIIRKRTAKTTMVVKDNQTLVVGGLILETRDGTREGIPVLSKIPILGYLFGSTKSQVTKTELVLLISPRVVNTIEEGDALTEQVKDRVLTLKKGIGQFGIKKKLEEFHPLQEKGQP